MRGFVMNIIANHLAAGHSATVFVAFGPQIRSVKYHLNIALDDLGVERAEGSAKLDCKLANGAFVQFGQLQEYTGASLLHTPVVVLFDVDKANLVLVPDARAVACRFPDGKPPILIEA